MGKNERDGRPAAVDVKPLDVRQRKETKGDEAEKGAPSPKSGAPSLPFAQQTYPPRGAGHKGKNVKSDPSHIGKNVTPDPLRDEGDGGLLSIEPSVWA